MANDVNFRIFANANDAEREIVSLQRKYENLTNKVKHLGDQQRRAKNAGAQWGRAVARQATSMIASYFGVQQMLTTLISKNRELAEQSRQIEADADRIFKKLNVQGGFDRLRGEEAKRQVDQMAVTYAPLDRDFIATAATELISQGFDPKEATSEALKVMIETILAANQEEGDPKLLAQSTSQFLSALGLEKNAENLQKLRDPLIGLFRSRSFQISDLSQLAPKSLPAISADFDMSSVLATFQTFKDIEGDAATASTSMKQFISFIRTASANKKAQKGLEMLGLQPADVDLVGEDIVTARDRLQQSLDALPKEQQQVALAQIFGRRNVAQAEGFIRSGQSAEGDRLATNLKLARDVVDVQAAVEEKTSGALATDQRQQQIEKMQLERRGGGDFLRTLDTMTQSQRAAGENEVSIWINRAVAHTFGGLGFPETGLWAAQSNVGDSLSAEEAKDLTKAMSEGAAAQRENTKAIEDAFLKGKGFQNAPARQTQGE